MKKTDINHLLECIEKISETAHHAAKLTDAKMNSCNSHTKDIAKYLKCTERQAFWFSILFAINLHRPEIDLEDISQYLKCSILSVFKYIDDLEQLVKLKVLRKSKSDRRRRRCPDRLDNLQFYIPTYIIQSIVNGDTKLPTRQKSDITVYELLDIYANLLQERDNELLTQDAFEEEMIVLLGENQHIPFVKSVQGFKLCLIDLALLLYVCSSFTDFEEGDLIWFLKTVFSHTSAQMTIRKEFMKGESRLQQLKLLETPTDDFRSDRSLVLTEYGKDLLFGEDKDLFLTHGNRKSDLILATEIKPQRLFFNTKEQEQLDSLTDLLKPDNFSAVCNRMRDMGLRTGFNILLSGKPGTGKSAACYMIGNQTGRDLFKISIETTKSKWYGESERLIAGLFDRYAKLVDTYETTPIMFLNECDGILSTRITVQGSVAQTSNSMQNLLLEGMENLNGILLATTNLTQNLDKAFERRFLYKIELLNPDKETLKLIWMDKIPGLTDADYQTLADRFDFSGGQLENIARKQVLSQILKGRPSTITEIIGFCNEEHIEGGKERKRIGFLA